MATNDSARAIVRTFLERYGLNFTSTQVDRWVGMVSDSGELIMPIIDEEIRQSDQFKGRFPGLAQRLENGHNQISVEEYLRLESQYLNVLRAAGLPRDFYDTPQSLATFISEDISPAELEFRVQRGVVAARDAPVEVRTALEEFYGIRPAESFLASYFLDPDVSLPLMERQLQSAMISGLASRDGFDVQRGQAELLSSLGVQSREQIQSGLQQASRNRALEQETVAERAQRDITDSDLLGASFGVDSESDRRLRRRLAERRASFGGSGAGGPAADQGGAFFGGQR